MKTIIDVVEKQIEKNGNCTVFTFLDDGETVKRSVPLSEIRADALKLASLLREGAAVLVLLPQSISFITAFFGCLYAHTIAVPVAVPTKNRGMEQLRSIINGANIQVGITDSSTLVNLHKWFGEDIVPITWVLIDKIEQSSADVRLPKSLTKPGSVAFVQYTSGSTGRPKGVMVTHENIVANSEIIQRCFHNNAESVSVCWLPSYHDMGLIDGIIQPVFSGFHSVLMSPTHFLQKPIRWFKAITEHRATYSGAPNFAFDLCNERISDADMGGIDLSSLRCLYNGSETVRDKTIRTFVQRFSSVGFTGSKMFACYGLAESTLAVTASKLGRVPPVVEIEGRQIVGCGSTLGDTTVTIVNPETLEPCKEKEIGEVWVTGKSIAAGYLNDAVSTVETFVEKDSERCLRTGDLGFLLGDELFVTGRIKDLIIIRGKNHRPQDIEQTAFISHSDLRANACAAFSVELAAEERLVVVQEIRRDRLKNVDYREIFESILADISRKHEVSPHDIVLISPNTLPKTTSGKIQRGACKILWQSQGLNSLAFLGHYLSYKQQTN